MILLSCLLECAGFVLAVCLAIAIGKRLSNLSPMWWGIGYAIFLPVVFGIAIVRRLPTAEFHPVVSWMVKGRLDFVFFAAGVSVMRCSRSPSVHSPSLGKSMFSRSGKKAGCRPVWALYGDTPL